MTTHSVDDVSDYESAGFQGTLTPGSSPALIVIDPCQAYADPTCPRYAGIEDAIATMRAP